MADLSVTYSKTPKGLRARSSFIGGLSGKLMKVLSFIDGVSKAQTILTKHDAISADKLLDALSKLENDGYIKPAVVKVFNDDDDDWDFESSADKMVVEEFSATKQEEAFKKIEADAQARLEAEQAQQAQAKNNEKAIDTEKAQQQEALIKAIEKAKAETKVQEYMQNEAAQAQKNLKLEALKKIKAAQIVEAAKIAKAKLAIEDKAKLDLSLQQQAAHAVAAAQANLTSQKLAETKAEALRLAAAESMRLDKVRTVQEIQAKKAKKATKAALEAEKIAFAEAEQMRLMAEFEAQVKREDAAKQQAADSALQVDDAAHATLVAEAKAKLKAKAEARAKADADKLALATAKENLK